MWWISIFGCLACYVITLDTNFVIAGALYAIALQLGWNRKGR